MRCERVEGSEIQFIGGVEFVLRLVEIEAPRSEVLPAATSSRPLEAAPPDAKRGEARCFAVPPGGKIYVCTRAAGHDGEHVAREVGGNVCARWHEVPVAAKPPLDPHAERRAREAPLVALVAAVPEGLDPVGWRAAVLQNAERGIYNMRDPLQSAEFFRSWPNCEAAIREVAATGTIRSGFGECARSAANAYRRALTRQPPPMRPGRVLTCNAYDVPGQP